MTNDGRVLLVTLHPCELIVHIVVAPLLRRAALYPVRSPARRIICQMTDDLVSKIVSIYFQPRQRRETSSSSPNINEAFSRHKPPFFTTRFFLERTAYIVQGRGEGENCLNFKRNLFLAKRPPLSQ